MVGIPDVITYANFGEDRLRGLGVAGGQSLPFSIDFDRRPYNTLALPCECVILEMVQDRDIVTMFHNVSMSLSRTVVAYQIAPTAMTWSDLEGHLLLAV